ncbi:MAG: copper homeostasis protein CutC [Prevotella sp.]|nr:copper homeostasis protein CutC [Prevotella sp.]
MREKPFLFEVCANSVESCLAAQEGGADRVELCAGIPEGGTTPSYGEIQQARKLLSSTLLHVIIRPRGGDFLYSPLEMERMETDIEMCRQLGVDGVVLGCLTADGEIDMEKNARLLASAKGMSVTFHRAFDHCPHPERALEQLIKLGFDRVLTSGQQPNALAGVSLLRDLVRQAGGRIAIMAGCGVNEHNILDIYRATRVNEYHFSARIPIKSEMRNINPNVYMGEQGVDENTILRTSAERVKNTINALLAPLNQ